MSTMAKGKIIFKRHIELKKYEEADIVQLLKHRDLFDSVFIAKPSSRASVKEF